MHRLSINTRVVLILGASLVIIFGAVTIVTSYQESQSLSRLYTKNAMEVNWLLNKQVSEIMANGDNEKIQQLAEEAVSKGLMQELTVVNRRAIVVQSSDPKKVNKPSEDTLWQTLFAASRDTVIRLEENGIPILASYEIFHNSEACSQCHDIGSGEILGGLKSVVSELPIKQAAASSYTRGALFALFGAILLIGGIALTLRKLVFLPLKDVTGKLDLASQGQTNQTIKVSSQDEIGRLLLAINRLIEYIRDFASASQKIADGDLRISISKRSDGDQLGLAYGKMVDNLDGMIRQIDGSARNLVSASETIANSAGDLCNGAQSQADQVNLVSASIEEMTATIVQTSGNTNSVSEIARSALQVSNKGTDLVGEAVSGMDRIQNRVRKSMNSVQSLADSNQKISNIVTMIDDISDQTNLLALNAAIEAARAGEQGRGFAVVAEEVRKLAEKTGKATAQIAGMIGETQTQMSEAVESMEAMVTEVDQGKTVVSETGKSLMELAAMVEQVTHTIEQIATAVQQQSVAAEDISKNIEHINSVDTAAHLKASQTTATDLSKQAEQLSALVRRFQLTEEH